MVVLAVASIVAWGRLGNGQLRDNWNIGRAPSTREIVHQIFNGVCSGMLGLTGFECVPAYVSRIKIGRFPRVLRNLHLPAIFLNLIMMLLIIAVVPLGTSLQGTNLLSDLAETVSRPPQLPNPLTYPSIGRR